MTLSDVKFKSDLDTLFRPDNFVFKYNSVLLDSESSLPDIAINTLRLILTIMKTTYAVLICLPFPLSLLVKEITPELFAMITLLDLTINGQLPMDEIKINLQKILNTLKKLVSILQLIPLLSYLATPLVPLLDKLQDIIDSLPDSN